MQKTFGADGNKVLFERKCSYYVLVILAQSPAFDGSLLRCDATFFAKSHTAMQSPSVIGTETKFLMSPVFWSWASMRKFLSAFGISSVCGTVDSLFAIAAVVSWTLLVVFWRANFCKFFTTFLRAAYHVQRFHQFSVLRHPITHHKAVSYFLLYCRVLATFLLSVGVFLLFSLFVILRKRRWTRCFSFLF